MIVFYSYADKDEVLRHELENHLSLLRHQGVITEWHDRLIKAGANRDQDTYEHLNKASIILLLISPDFLASDYRYEIEMQRALERHNAGEAHVIPIILRPCDWKEAPFGRLQCLPSALAREVLGKREILPLLAKRSVSAVSSLVLFPNRSCVSALVMKKPSLNGLTVNRSQPSMFFQA